VGVGVGVGVGVDVGVDVGVGVGVGVGVIFGVGFGVILGPTFPAVAYPTKNIITKTTLTNKTFFSFISIPPFYKVLK